MSNQANAPLDQENRSSGGDYLELAYTQLNDRYAEITDFRAKLLGLLPLATGAGAGNGAASASAAVPAY